MVMGTLLPPLTGVFVAEESVPDIFAISVYNTSFHVTDEKYSNNNHVIDQVVNTLLHYKLKQLVTAPL